jgi:hypothetical protein
MKTLWRGLWRLLRGAGLLLAALVFAIEEWGWRPLTRLAERLARWGPIERLERRIRAAPPGLALALFLVPALLLFPIKVFALWLIHLGRTSLGVSAIVLAKLLGTALLGRLFVLTEPQLVHFRWFARTLEWWRATKRRVREALRQWTPWQAVRRAWRRTSLWVRRRVRSAR